jgi:beta-lactam-binding protein with PASTA domain
MPLLDGKYEIISESALGPEQTLFDATTPEGEAVRIVWYELTPEQEARFEAYRRAIKHLKRCERAAVYDVVSRPGAHYVAWRPPEGVRPANPDSELESLLTEAGFRVQDADIRRDQRRTMVYGLAFDGTPLPQVKEAGSDRPPRPAPRRPVEPPAWLVTVLVTLLLAGTAAALLRGGVAARSNDTLVVMPALIGSDVNEALRRLHGLGLEVEAAPIASERKAGTVLKLEPEAGSQLRPGRAVRVSYALPPGSVTPAEVPRVVARRYPEEAEQSLTERGLTLGSISRIPAEQAAGLVISQAPAAGTLVGQGSAIDLLVSDGPSELMTFLPDLTGMPVEEARYLARLAGLRPERIIEDEVPAARGSSGIVMAQSLRPNQPIARDDAVLRLIVARSERAPETAQGLPSFVGLSLEEARELAGSLAVEVDEMSDRALPEGVVDQSPAAATPASGELTLVVNIHPVPIPRPEPRARVRRPEPRSLEYAWLIEPGIPQQLARVYATTLEGQRTLVRVATVRGGEEIMGAWRTRYPGLVRFSLTLNDVPYGIDLLAH